ncbi:hypothetical protein LGN17_35645 [Burkholderia sp. AU30280]|uniref:hypothetical protein n=1 Tax=Burkholderia sp. AU30280 TaxID=2879628 RepID=UPI001CF28EA3|nr:hypothetical protein [Burkholderia sp. AU30280]MCA8277821.1 hypothetical protein [Burkholderia sp. AU30280]
MRFSELLGASLTAAIVGGVLIGVLSIRDFGVVSLLFAVVAFVIAFLSAIILSYPMAWLKAMIPSGAVFPVVAIVGGIAATLILAVLTKASWADMLSINKLVLLYSAIGVVCAISAFGYIERSVIFEGLRKLFG